MVAKRAVFSLLSLSVFAVCLHAQKAPAGLQVTSASKSQVVLSWTAVPGATGYEVDRKAGAGAFAAIGDPVTTTTATDTKVDAYTTYTYHVRALGAPVSGKPAPSAPSNDVNTGPAPVGFSVVAPSPKDQQDDFGVGMVMTLDADDDPIYAWIFSDPNHTGNKAESLLEVAGWDRANNKWRAPQKVDVIGNAPTSQIPLSLALDKSTGTLGMAWLRADSVRQVAFSTDNGVTWTQQNIAAGDGQDAESNSIALANGKVYLAYFTGAGPIYITGNETDDASKWTHTPGPAASGGGYRGVGHLALDSAGQPGIAFLFAPASGGASANFWRPGSDPSKAFDSNGGDNDLSDIRLAFAGLKPRILAAGSRDSVEFHTIWISSSDDGSSWSDPALIPNDGNRGMRGPMTIAISAKPTYAVVSTDHGGNFDGVKCKWPKLSLSPDAIHWTTCSPATSDANNRDNYPSAEFDGMGRLYLAFQYQGDINGLMVYHEGATAAASAVVHK